MSSLKVLYFSPVGTTERVAKAIDSGINTLTTEWIDLSDPQVREKAIEFNQDDLVLMIFPVYAGRVVRIPRYFFKKIKGNGASAITVVTYGNRAYDDALFELSKLAVDSGFKQLGAAAFVCEHSFDIALAEGRPDTSDIDYAKSFGQKIMDKFNSEIKLGVEKERLANEMLNGIPGDYPFRTQFRHDFGGPLVPETSESCISCGRCASKCPVRAIASDDFMSTDAKKCITCFRCIRKCPVKARRINLPDFIDHAEWLAGTYQERKAPEIFL